MQVIGIFQSFEHDRFEHNCGFKVANMKFIISIGLFVVAVFAQTTFANHDGNLVFDYSQRKTVSFDLILFNLKMKNYSFLIK